MKLSLLIIASIPPGIFASIEELRSEFGKSLLDAPRIVGMKGVKSFLANFCLDQDIDRVSSMLKYRKFPYQEVYERIGESPERQNQLFEELFSVTINEEYHETLLSPGKLWRNHILARRIFLEVKPIVYKGGFFTRGLDFRFDFVYEKDKDLAMTMLRHCIMEQMSMINDVHWLSYFLHVAEEDHAHEIFQLLLDRQEVTPEIFKRARSCWNWKGGKKLTDPYFKLDPALPREDLLMHCALLVIDVWEPRIPAECKGLEPRNNLDKLREIALLRGDRQSISTLFYWKAKYWWRGDLDITEMLEYIKLGRLSPATTSDFIKWAFSVKVELGSLPLEHLLSQPPQALTQLSKEDRLSKWLCSSDLMYEDVTITGLDKLYYHSVRMSINIKFTEPVEVKGGRVVTRAAEYFIWNARAVLNTYRSFWRGAMSIAFGDYQKILVGILYALAEGQHLDFSNTDLEMRKGDRAWSWFEAAAEHPVYQGAAKTVLKYLNSNEIYESVHEASPQQCDKYGQAKAMAEITDGIAGLLSITSSD